MADEVGISTGVLFNKRHPNETPKIAHPLIFWMHDVNVTIPTGVWTPLPWNRTLTTKPSVSAWAVFPGTGSEATTTIAAGSNGQALPQGTINVVDTSAFKANADWPTGGKFLVIRIGGTDRVVRYTGKTGTSFTGCTLGVGTMTTGDTVRQANVHFDPPTASLGPATAEVSWASNATGVRGLRFRDSTSFQIILGTDVRAAVVSADPLLRSQTTEQPASTGGVGVALGALTVEAFQSSGGNLDSVATGGTDLSSPRLVIQAGGGFVA